MLKLILLLGVLVVAGYVGALWHGVLCYNEWARDGVISIKETLGISYIYYRG